jgi:hypothetical protein
MGVIHDYFRAPDAAAAMGVMNLPGGPLSKQSLFDGVSTKGIDPVLMLGQLLAFIRQVLWEPDISSSKTLWPPPDTEPSSEQEYKELPQDSPWKTGPWLWELGLQARDNLASVDDARMPDIAAQWAEIEEFRGLLQTDDALVLIRDLVGLARRAGEAGDRLYCWTCL